jgi:predicted transcriptional regulator
MADEKLVLSQDEAKLVKRIAEQHGISEEEAAELVVKKEVARRVRLRTGKGPAKVYSIKRKQ